MIHLIIAYVVLSLAVLIALVTTGVLFLITWSMIFTKAPFVPIAKKVLPEIIKAMDIKSDSKVYDLGCGDGRVLIAAWRSQPRAKYVGLDKDWLPMICSWWQLRRTDQPKNIVILRRDFFKQDLSNATHIFTYLFPKLMDQLLPKLQAELQPGTKLISCDFYFTNKKPSQIIDLQRSKNALAKKLYVYKF